MPEENKLTGYPSIDKPWLKYYSEEAIHSPLPEGTVYEYIKRVNQDNLDRIALNYYGKELSYRSFFEQIDSISNSLVYYGVKEGDVVTICTVNSPESVLLYLALNRLGAIANMIVGSDAQNDIIAHLNDTKTELVFTLDLFQNTFLEILNRTKVHTVVVMTITQGMSVLNRLGARLMKGIKETPLPNDRRFMKWSDFLSHSATHTWVSHNAKAPAVITYTGGTTGGSKGVMLSNYAILSVAHQYIMGEKNLHRNSTWVQIVPLFTAYGITCSLGIPLIVGMTLIIRIPMSEPLSSICKKYHPNHIIYGPAFWEKFADYNANLDLSTLIAPISGGDTLRPSVERKVNDYLKSHKCAYPLMNGYGMTEVGAAVSVNFKEQYEFGSVGAPFIHNIIAAFDPETGEELQYGQEGEICIHTPSMMIGYLNNPTETTNVIRRHADGNLWVHSGDLGFISDRGFIHISGRLKRYFNYANNGVWKKVFSLDIEKALLQNPNVENCAVVPISDDIFNQVAFAYIILKHDKATKDVIEQELRSYCESNLQQAYRPVQYRFIEAFPLTKVGKVDYLKLEKLAEETRQD